jgi:uncharacterized protein (DUF2141 family)
MQKFFFMGILSLLIAACGSAQPIITDNGKPGQIKVFVFQDENNNGKMDAGEKGLPDRVLLSQGDTCPPQTKDFTQAATDVNGEALFNNLKPGVYCVGYYGDNAITTQIAVKINLSSEQQADVFYGIIP